MSDNKADILNINKADTSRDVIEEQIKVSRPVYLMRKDTSSGYFARNVKFMPEVKSRVGASINAVVKIKENMEEWYKYMPSILNARSNSDDFNKLFDLYLNNISHIVSEGGDKLEAGFIFSNKKVAEAHSKASAAIYDEFNKADKSRPELRDQAFKTRDEKIVALEQRQYKVGTPINVSEYLLWRYCIHYGDVANDIALINKSGAIRFYLQDPKLEEYKRKVMFDYRKEATLKYVELLKDTSKINNLLWIYLDGATDVTALNEMEKVDRVEAFKNDNPERFIKTIEDKDLEIKATIQMMIYFGVLRRLSGSDVIVDENNDIIGNNTRDAIIFFKNTEKNKANITRFNAKLKNYLNG